MARIVKNGPKTEKHFPLQEYQSVYIDMLDELHDVFTNNWIPSAKKMLSAQVFMIKSTSQGRDRLVQALGSIGEADKEVRMLRKALDDEDVFNMGDGVDSPIVEALFKIAPSVATVHEVKRRAVHTDPARIHDDGSFPIHDPNIAGLVENLSFVVSRLMFRGLSIHLEGPALTKYIDEFKAAILSDVSDGSQGDIMNRVSPVLHGVDLGLKSVLDKGQRSVRSGLYKAFKQAERVGLDMDAMGFVSPCELPRPFGSMLVANAALEGKLGGSWEYTHDRTKWK